MAKKCPSCSAKLASNAEFCPECDLPQPPVQKSSGGLKIVAFLVGAFVALAIVGGVISVVDHGASRAGDTAADNSATLNSTGSTDQAAPDPAPSPKAIKPTRYHGSGDRIVRIRKPSGQPDEAIIVTIAHHGQSNFAVWTLNKKLKQTELLVNTIGDYRGTVPVDLEDGSETRRIQVQADGSWTITIRPVTSARHFSGSIKGKGDDVVFYTAGPKVANIKHSGSGNFAVWFYGEDGRDLLVNDIGKYKGQSPFTGKALLAITADGSWSIVAK